MNNKKLLITLLFVYTKITFAAVMATVDRSDLSLGQSLNLTITLPSSSAEPELGILKSNFDIYGTSKSSQTSIINGQVNSQTTLTLSLMPKTSGKQAIPPIKIGNDSTQAIPLNVSASQQQNTTKTNNNDQKQAIYLEANTSEKNVYPGVPFIYSIKLYYSVALDNLQMASIDMPNAKIEPLGKAIPYQSNQAQQNYQVIEQKFLITANKAGTLTIPAAKIQGISLANTGNSNDLFAMGGSSPFNVISPAITLNVKPIPADLDADEWLPAKSLQLTESWAISANNLKIGEPITRTITLTALGIPASLIPNFDFTTPNDVSDYPDKPQVDTSINNDQLVAHKSFKIVYIANKAGTLVFPEIKVKWWDLSSNSLKTAILPTKTYQIANDPNLLNKPIIASSNVVTLAAKSLSKAADTPASKTNNFWYFTSLILGLLWLATIGIIIVIFIYKKLKAKKFLQATSLKKAASTNKIPSMLKINLAYQDKDIHALQHALLEWASVVWAKKIHSLDEIKALAQQDALNIILDKLNLALYKGIAFTEFDELLVALNQLKKPAHIKPEPSLKTFYPE